MRAILCLAASLLLLVLPSTTQAKVHQKLPAYPHNALEPVVSQRSLEQHLLLHAWYVQRTNEIVQGTILDKLPLQAIVLSAPYHSELYNVSLQSYNHNFAWSILAPPSMGGGGAPKGNLGQDIDKTFGSLAGLKKAFIEESRNVFASGYVSLIKRTCDGELAVVANGDADNPLRLGQGIPLVSLDLWEHAYLLDVSIYREKYILDSFLIINWPQAEKIYDGDLTVLLS